MRARRMGTVMLIALAATALGAAGIEAQHGGPGHQPGVTQGHSCQMHAARAVPK